MISMYIYIYTQIFIGYFEHISLQYKQISKDAFFLSDFFKLFIEYLVKQNDEMQIKAILKAEEAYAY